MLYPLDELKYLFIVFTGDSFVLFGNDEERNVSFNDIPFLSNKRTVNDEIKIIQADFSPITVSISNRVDDNSTCTFTIPITTENNTFIFNRREGNRFEGDDTSFLNFSQLISNYTNRDLLIESSQKSEFWKEYFELNNFAFYYEPETIFQPFQPIWIFVKVEKQYYRLFTGLIFSISENDRPGNERNISITCISGIGLLKRTSVITQAYTYFLVKDILPKKDRDLYYIYLMSMCFIGDSLEEIKSLDKSATDIRTLMKYILSVVNRTFVTIPTDDNYRNLFRNLMNNAPQFLGSFPQTKKKEPVPELEDNDSIDKYFNRIENYKPFRLKYFDDSFIIENNFSDSEYEGNENIVGESIEFKNLLHNGAIFSFKMGSNFSNTDAFLAINRVYATSAQLWKIESISVMELIRRVVSTFSLHIFDDVTGEVVLDYPQLNRIPLIDKAYEDHDKKYIFERDKCTFTYNNNTGNIIELLTVPFQYHYSILGSAQDYKSRMMTGRSYMNLESFWSYGYNKRDLNNVFVTYFNTMDDPVDMYNDIAKALHQRYNSTVFETNITLKGGFDLRLLRNVYIPQKEYLYMITSINHTINIGNDFNTVVNATYGHPIWYYMDNPWLKHADKLKNTAKPAPSKKIPTSTAMKVDVISCNQVAKAMNTVMKKIYNDGVNWYNRVIDICDYIQKVTLTLQKASAEVLGAKVKVDPRMIYIFAMIDKLINEDDEIRDYTITEINKIGNVMDDRFDIKFNLTVSLANSSYFHGREGRVGKISGFDLVVFGKKKGIHKKQTEIDVRRYCLRDIYEVDFDPRTKEEENFLEMLSTMIQEKIKNSINDIFPYLTYQENPIINANKNYQMKKEKKEEIKLVEDAKYYESMFYEIPPDQTGKYIVTCEEKPVRRETENGSETLGKTRSDIIKENWVLSLEDKDYIMFNPAIKYWNSDTDQFTINFKSFEYDYIIFLRKIK